MATRSIESIPIDCDHRWLILEVNVGYKYPKFQFEYENEHLKNVIKKQKKIISLSVIFAISAALIFFIILVKNDNETTNLHLIEMPQQSIIVLQPQISVKPEKQISPAQPKPDFDEVYKKPKECDKPSNDKKFVECVNHYIRSKSQYDSISQ